MRKIIHLSDLHYVDSTSADAIGAALDRIATHTACRPDDYVVVVTGDLLDQGRDWGVTGFRAVLDLFRLHLPEPRYRLLVCPGNHDYGTGSEQNKGCALDFADVFTRLVVGRDSAGRRPWVDLVDNTIAFVGLDSMEAEVAGDRQFMASGRLGEAQLTDLARVLTTPPVCRMDRRVVYLHHNPFGYKSPLTHVVMRLRDADGLCRVLSEVRQAGFSIDALLFGHSHNGGSYPGGWPCVPQCYDGGAATGHQGFWAKKFGVSACAVARIISLEGPPAEPETIPLK